MIGEVILSYLLGSIIIHELGVLVNQPVYIITERQRAFNKAHVEAT
jgi:hypothetical protein